MLLELGLWTSLVLVMLCSEQEPEPKAPLAQALHSHRLSNTDFSPPPALGLSPAFSNKLLPIPIPIPYNLGPST
jgi:hypothetical protein